MNWHDLFEYDTTSGNLIRKVTMSSRAQAGDVVTSKHGTGYLKVVVNYKSYLVHRIIWEMHHGPIAKGLEVDHINHIRDDNRIDNLRLVSSAVNKQNLTLKSNNSSGHCGVHWAKDRNKWMAKIRVAGKYINLGRFDSLSDAVNARKNAEVKYGFHSNHGLAKDAAL